MSSSQPAHAFLLLFALSSLSLHTCYVLSSYPGDCCYQKPVQETTLFSILIISATRKEFRLTFIENEKWKMNDDPRKRSIWRGLETKMTNFSLRFSAAI